MRKYIFCSVLAAAVTSNVYALENPDPIRYSWTVESGDVKEVRRLLQEGLSPNYKGSVLGASPGLHVAAWTGNIEMLKTFLEFGADINLNNDNGEQPLALAAYKGHTKAVDYLISNGAKLNRRDNGWGALHYAVFNGHKELSQKLISMGADINARTPNGSTPLILAAYEGHEDLAKTLVASGADTRIRNDWGLSALTMAIKYDRLRLAQAISSKDEFQTAFSNSEPAKDVRRSEVPPKSIAEILERIRQANMDKMPTYALQEQLSSAIEEHKRTTAVKKVEAVRAATLEITAKRGKPQEQNAKLIITR